MYTHRKRYKLKRKPAMYSQFTLTSIIRISGRRVDVEFGCTRSKSVSIYLYLSNLYALKRKRLLFN